jgi:hypothetical protein
MDALSTAIGISNLGGSSQPKSLAEWNTRYEALSIEHDWWFKAAVAVASFARASIKTIAHFTATPAPRAAHA